MPTLAGPLPFPPPPTNWRLDIGPITNSVANFLWCGLSHDTRITYTTAVLSYEYFCTTNAVTAWQAQATVLAEWANTIENYLSALRSVHIDRRLPTTLFEGEWLKRLLAGIRHCKPPATKKQAAPLTIELLRALPEPSPVSLLCPTRRRSTT